MFFSIFFTSPTSTPIIFFFPFSTIKGFFVNRKRNPFPHYPLHLQLLHINIFTEMLSKTFASSTLRLAAVRRSAPALQQVRYASTNQDDRHVCSTIYLFVEINLNGSWWCWHRKLFNNNVQLIVFSIFIWITQLVQ